jgi:hypothetical protein
MFRRFCFALFILALIGCAGQTIVVEPLNL